MPRSSSAHGPDVPGEGEAPWTVHGVLATRPPSALAQGSLANAVPQTCINMVFKSKSQRSPEVPELKHTGLAWIEPVLCLKAADQK